MPPVRKLNRNEKLMIALIIVLAIGVILRWGFIKKEVSDSFKERFAPDKHETEIIID